MIYIIVFGILGIGSIAFGTYLFYAFKKMDSITLVQGKLEDNGSDIQAAIPYLKITNEWNTKMN